jgi:hypothetical protein
MPRTCASWALVLSAQSEKAGWTAGMALRFEERDDLLSRVDPPDAPGRRWVYRFEPWPETLVFRRLVDYEEDAAARAAADPQGSRLSRWLSGGRRE